MGAHMIDASFQGCIDALDGVTKAFRQGRVGLSVPSRYEADRAAFKLMQQVWLHINSISHLAAIPYTGSHLASACVLLRSAFETAVVALWLTQDEDWRERESRWLGWVAGQEKYLANLAREFDSRSPMFAGKLRGQLQDLCDRREAITRLLPKDSRVARPPMPQLIREVGMEQPYYIPYRVMSHICHGGPGSWEYAVRDEGAMIVFTDVVKPSAWKDPFRMGGWCIAQPGMVVLARAGATKETCHNLLAAHTWLLQVTEGLKDDD